MCAELEKPSSWVVLSRCADGPLSGKDWEIGDFNCSLYVETWVEQERRRNGTAFAFVNNCFLVCCDLVGFMDTNLSEGERWELGVPSQLYEAVLGVAFMARISVFLRSTWQLFFPPDFLLCCPGVSLQTCRLVFSLRPQETLLSISRALSVCHSLFLPFPFAVAGFEDFRYSINCFYCQFLERDHQCTVKNLPWLCNQ